MREKIETQIGMFSQYSNHEFSDELKRVSEILDSMPTILDLVATDLKLGNDPRGAQGMAVESVLRAAILLRIRDWTYRELSFHIADSKSTHAFLRLKDFYIYSRSTLQANISKISPKTWEIINQNIVRYAITNKMESVKTVRVDSTVVDSNIHKPTDASLLADCMRVISRLHFRTLEILKNKALFKLAFQYKNAKYLALSIVNAKNEENRVAFYNDLLIECGDVFIQLPKLLQIVSLVADVDTKKFLKITMELRRIQKLMSGIISQTISRVIDGESAPAKDKIVSIFEEHSDVIVKDRRETHFGHKIFVTTWKNNLVLDCTITEGNPADSELFMPLIERIKMISGKTPNQVAADGGFASRDNLLKAKEKGITDVCFAKKCGLAISDMARSTKVYKQLRNFRAGIESNISALKRGFGLDRAIWKGFDGFKNYVMSGIVSCNLRTLGAKIK